MAYRTDRTKTDNALFQNEQVKALFTRFENSMTDQTSNIHGTDFSMTYCKDRINALPGYRQIEFNKLMRQRKALIPTRPLTVTEGEICKEFRKLLIDDLKVILNNFRVTKDSQSDHVFYNQVLLKDYDNVLPYHPTDNTEFENSHPLYNLFPNHKKYFFTLPGMEKISTIHPARWNPVSIDSIIYEAFDNEANKHLPKSYRRASTKWGNPSTNAQRLISILSYYSERLYNLSLPELQHVLAKKQYGELNNPHPAVLAHLYLLTYAIYSETLKVQSLSKGGADIYEGSIYGLFTSGKLPGHSKDYFAFEKDDDPWYRRMLPRVPQELLVHQGEGMQSLVDRLNHRNAQNARPENDRVSPGF